MFIQTGRGAEFGWFTHTHTYKHTACSQRTLHLPTHILQKFLAELLDSVAMQEFRWRRQRSRRRFAAEQERVAHGGRGRCCVVLHIELITHAERRSALVNEILEPHAGQHGLEEVVVRRYPPQQQEQGLDEWGGIRVK